MFRTILCACSLLAATICARADTFKLNFNDGVDNTLTLTSSTSSNGVFTISSATGTIDGLLASLSPLGSYGGNDNLLLYPAQNNSYLDFNGLTFNLSNGIQYNLYYNSNPGTFGYRYSSNNNAAYPINSLSVSSTASTAPVSVTPEPSSLALLGTGVLSLAGFARRRFIA